MLYASLNRRLYHQDICEDVSYTLTEMCSTQQMYIESSLTENYTYFKIHAYLEMVLPELRS